MKRGHWSEYKPVFFPTEKESRRIGIPKNKRPDFGRMDKSQILEHYKSIAWKLRSAVIAAKSKKREDWIANISVLSEGLFLSDKRRQVVYMDDAALCEFLLSQKIDIRADEIRFPFLNGEKPFALSFPRDFSINGVEVPSILIQWFSRKSVTIMCGGERWPGEQLTVITMRDGYFDPISVPIAHDKDIGYDSSAATQKMGFSSPLVGIMNEVTHIVLALSQFVRSDVCEVRDGFPVSMKPAYRNQSAAHTVGVNQTLVGNRQLFGAHLRRGHFRTLRAERYSRNSDGSPKVVYVRECVVGPGEPKTAARVSVKGAEATL